MQNSWSYIPYYEDEHVQSITLGFLTGGGLTIILPKDGDAVGLLSSMTGERFDGMHTQSIGAEGRLLLPRFSIESTLESLKDALIYLGVPLFDEALSPLIDLVEEADPVFLYEAAQVAKIDVDEEGTTAVAVTVMIGIPGSAPPQPERSFEMICNSPFVFILHRNTVDGDRQILFTGVVNQP